MDREKAMKVPLTDLVRRYPNMEEKDLTLLFSKRLEAVSQSWFLSVAFVIGLLTPLVLLGINLSLQPVTPGTLYTILGVLAFEIILVLALRHTYQSGTLGQNQETHLKDYLEARKIIRDRAKLVMAPSLS